MPIMSWLRGLFGGNASVRAHSDPMVDDSVATPKNEPRSLGDGAAVDVYAVASAAFAAAGHGVSLRDGVLQHDTSDIVVALSLFDVHTTSNGAIRTSVGVELRHPRFGAEALYEYQHSHGDSAEAACRTGMEQWIRVDFAVLIDALRAEPQDSLCMRMRFAEDHVLAGKTRRVLFGPVMHYGAAATTTDANACPADGTHDFCPCCLLTQNMDAFKNLLEDDGFHAIRLYAARDVAGQPTADCRVNGQDYDAGAQALTDYVGRWPGNGFEFRKQYVVIQTAPADDAAPAPAAAS